MKVGSNLKIWGVDSPPKMGMKFVMADHNSGPLKKMYVELEHIQIHTLHWWGGWNSEKTFLVVLRINILFYIAQGALNTEGMALHYCSPIQKRNRIVLNY